MMSLDSIVTAHEQQISCDLGDETVVLNLKSGDYYGLDPVGARIWSWLRTPVSVREIRDRLVRDYGEEPDRIERDVFALLERLAGEGLIEVTTRIEGRE